jgi:hypothetical protein
MSSITGTAIPQSSAPTFPHDLFLLGEFKAYVEQLVAQTGIPLRFKPRLYSYADYVLTKFYALVTKQSTAAGSEALNRHLEHHYWKKYHLNLKPFGDRIRYRRLVPHQTDIDKFFRLLTENEIHFLFGNLLANFNQKIRKAKIGGSKLRLLVDNTEYPYYGKLHPPYEVGTHRQPGTHKARLFQTMALQGCGMTLFTEFRVLRHNQYRAKHIGIGADWLKWQGFNVSYLLLDREFYRAALMKELKSRKYPVIMPAKKFLRVHKEIFTFLTGIGPLVRPYFFAQTQKAKPWPSSVHLHLAFVGHDDQSALAIRNAYRNGTLSLQEAVHQLAGFFTTLRPRQNQARWCRWLTRAYKHRWCEETGFRMLNEVHDNYRNHTPFTQLSQLYLRALIYNNWQYCLKIQVGSHIHRWELALDQYQQRLGHRVEEIVAQSVRQNLKYLQKNRRDVYFRR